MTGIDSNSVGASAADSCRMEDILVRIRSLGEEVRDREEKADTGGVERKPPNWTFVCARVPRSSSQRVL